MKIRAVMVFIITLLIFTGCACLVLKTQEQRARLQAVYTAETTIGKIESMMNKYLAKSDLMKNIIEGGYELDDARFSHLSQLLQDEDSSVIQAFEMAKDGIVSQIYPLEGNEEAMGLNMLGPRSADVKPAWPWIPANTP